MSQRHAGVSPRRQWGLLPDPQISRRVMAGPRIKEVSTDVFAMLGACTCTFSAAAAYGILPERRNSKAEDAEGDN